MRQIVREVASILFSVSLNGTGKEVFLKNASILSKKAEQQTANKDVQVVQIVVTAEFIVATQFIMQLG